MVLNDDSGADGPLKLARMQRSEWWCTCAYKVNNVYQKRQIVCIKNNYFTSLSTLARASLSLRLP
ncbi:MAG: hypothetical protein JWQ66_1545 [Mucilaginibacter sp.]|nr:hypothetical protein [Mucilaginibacter sp.]